MMLARPGTGPSLAGGGLGPKIRTVPTRSDCLEWETSPPRYLLHVLPLTPKRRMLDLPTTTGKAEGFRAGGRTWFGPSVPRFAGRPERSESTKNSAGSTAVSMRPSGLSAGGWGTGSLSKPSRPSPAPRRRRPSSLRVNSSSDGGAYNKNQKTLFEKSASLKVPYFIPRIPPISFHAHADNKQLQGGIHSEQTTSTQP